MFDLPFRHARGFFLSLATRSFDTKTLRMALMFVLNEKVYTFVDSKLAQLLLWFVR